MPEGHIGPPRSVTEAYWTSIPGNRIEGTLPLPTHLMQRHFGPRRELRGLDVGAGNGNSTAQLRDALPGRITVVDLNAEGLDMILARGLADEAHVATSDALPFPAEQFNYVAAAGLMTNLAGWDIPAAQRQRRDTASEFARVVQPGGLVVVSDITPVNVFANPTTRYDRAARVTGEMHTVGTWYPQRTLEAMTDDEFDAFAAARVEPGRITHHYMPDEMAGLFEDAGLTTIHRSVHEGRSPSGKGTDVLIYVAAKPE